MGDWGGVKKTSAPSVWVDTSCSLSCLCCSCFGVWGRLFLDDRGESASSSVVNRGMSSSSFCNLLVPASASVSFGVGGRGRGGLFAVGEVGVAALGNPGWPKFAPAVAAAVAVALRTAMGIGFVTATVAGLVCSKNTGFSVNNETALESAGREVFLSIVVVSSGV